MLLQLNSGLRNPGGNLAYRTRAAQEVKQPFGLGIEIIDRTGDEIVVDRSILVGTGQHLSKVIPGAEGQRRIIT